ncbi:cytochrome P450 [Pseudohyphozyma bogoriensis]|nr:cytochrome P450 [Pseudohyphozyma bogoriensis]
MTSAGTISSLLPLAAILFTTYSFLILYRTFHNLFFSPISHIPGPFFAKCSSMWNVYQMAKGRKILLLHELFDKYGGVVRIGPNSVAVRDAKYLGAVYQSKLDKAAYYKGFDTNSVPNSFSAIHHASASGKRKSTLPHYSTASLITYQSTFDKHISKLVRVLGEYGEAPAVDMIGLASNTLTDRGLLGPTLWSLLSHVPVQSWQEIVHADKRFASFVGQCVLQAQDELASNITIDRPSLAHRLLRATDPNTGEQWTFDAVVAECMDDFLAGTETTTAGLSYTLYYLSMHSKAMEKLQAELDAVMEPGQVLGVQNSARLPYLDAVIKEGLRMSTGYPGTLDRVTSSTGINVDGCFVPPGTEVGMQVYTVHHDKGIWGDDCHEFRPERFLDATPEMKAAFIPFSIGARNCPGQNLAIFDLRLLLSAIARSFNVVPAATTTPESMVSCDSPGMTPRSGEVRLHLQKR